MYRILEKRSLNPTVTLMRIEAPAVAKKAEPGQFIILRTDAEGERIPLTVADFDRQSGSVTIIFQIVGATTQALNAMNEGDCLHDFVGPLGKATETAGKKRVAVVGGSGDDFIPVARAIGADTYVSGEFGHHALTDEPDAVRGINLIEAGHFYTEQPVCKALSDMIAEIDSAIACDIISSNPIKAI